MSALPAVRRRLAPRQAGLAFWAGAIVTLVALSPPLHALADASFAAHMVQHLLLILVAAPLLALGQPLGTLLRLLPRRRRRPVGAAYGSLLGRPAMRGLWRFLTGPLVSWTLHTVAVWAWHVPAVFEAALASDAVHAVEHACFLGTGVLYWWTLLREGSHRRHGYAVGVLSVFAMAMQGSALGALITFSSVPWYPQYAASAAQLGLTPLEDQQLAGLIMWVPAGFVYTAVALAFFALWLRGEEAQERMEVRLPR